MTATGIPDFCGACVSPRGAAGGAARIRGHWTLAAGGATARRRRSRCRPLGGTTVRSLPLVSGALTIAEPLHLTVGELALAVDKIRSVRLTVTDLVSLGNRRFSVDMLASPLGPDGGPDEPARFEGLVEPTPDGALRLTLQGAAPAALGCADTRLRLSALFHRLR